MTYGTLVKLVRIGVFLGILGGLVVGGGFLYEFYRAPRMKNQPNIRAFEAYLPPIPAGTVPVRPGPVLPAPERADGLINPLAMTEETIAAGKVYYTYYCTFCHGEEYDGNGPVGLSYMPVPTDLTSPRVQNYGDGKLLLAILTGTGHEPVLQRVVPPEHWWYLTAFVRSLPTQERGLESTGTALPVDPGAEWGRDIGPATEPEAEKP